MLRALFPGPSKPRPFRSSWGGPGCSSSTITLRKIYLRITNDPNAEGNSQEVVDFLKEAVDASHQTALEILVQLFAWLDSLEPIATTHRVLD